MATIRLNCADPAVLDGRNIRASAFYPARVALLDKLFDRSGRPPAGATSALAIGTGYSQVPNLLHHRGFDVTVVDPSAEAVSIASQTDDTSTYLVGPPTALPLPNAQFDLVFCADTLETHDDLNVILAEVARVTTAGATIIFDTVANTPIARLIYLLAFQRFSFTKIMPAHRYASERLRPPDQLAEACDHVGIDLTECLGFEPASPLVLIRALLDRRSGRIGDGGLADAAGFGLSEPGHEPVVTYFGIGRRRG